jgi:Ca-activated chloride channel family protein
MIHFIRPLWFAALIPGLIYLIWVIHSYSQSNPWKKVCDPHLLPALLQDGAHKSKLFFHSVLVLFFIMSIVALAGPAWTKEKLPIFRDASSLMVVLDLSPAMLDVDLKPDRLTRAKLKIRDLINTAQNTQMGLVVFTQEPFVVSPLSQDANTLNGFLDELQPQMMPVAGSDIGAGLKQAVSLIEQSAVGSTNILLITASESTASSLEIAKSIAESGHHLNVLAMMESNSNTQGTITKLQELAQTGDGSFYLFTPDVSDVKQILTTHASRQVLKDDKVENATVWQDAGPWLCLLLIPLALIVLHEKVRYDENT